MATSKLDELYSSVKNDACNVSQNQNADNFACARGGKPCTLYSTVLKSKSAVIIKPKDQSQKNSVIKCEILHEINPVGEGINISSVKNIKDGGVVIGCSEEQDVQTLKALVSSKLTARYDVKEVPGILPRIRIVGMSDKFDENTLTDFIRKQNKSIFDDSSKCTVLKIWPVKNKSR